jgi:YD repeat-containing protein
MRYRNVAAAIDWLCAAFGFERHHVVTGDEGDTLYAHLTLGSGMIMVGPVRDWYLDRLMKQPDEICGAETQSCYFVVEDADAHYHKAKAAGAGIVLDISDGDHGGRGYSCRDPEGHVWSFGTYDPWQRNPLATSRGNRLNRPVIMAAMLASITAAATAGWMLPRPAPNADETRLRFDAVAAHERAEKEVARANLLAAELARERSAKDAAERAAHEAREQLALEQGAKKTAERNARQLEGQVAEERRAKEVAERTAKDESEQMTKERTAREAEQRIASDMEKELTRERDAKQRAERYAQDALEQLSSERRAKEDAERAAKEAREQLAEAQKVKTSADQSAREPPARQSRKRSANEKFWDCRPRPPTGHVICRPIISRGKQ